MKYEFKVIKERDFLESPEVKELIQNSPTASVFQTIPFFNFFDNQANTQILPFFLLNDQELILSTFVVLHAEPGIKRNFTKRAIIYGGPVIKNPMSDKKTALEFLFNHINSTLSPLAIYLEIRNLVDLSEFKPSFRNLEFQYLSYGNFLIDISDPDQALMNFKSEKRRQIRKAIKNGVLIKKANSRKEIEALHGILKLLYRKRVKKPLPSVNYFLEMFEMFESHKNGFISVLIKEGEIIGGSFCPVFRGIVYDWYRCGLDVEFKKCYPSTLAVYAGIKLGHESGGVLFDFMGAGNLNEAYGVRNFKAQFGGQLIEYGRFRKILKPVLYKTGKLGLKIMQKLK